MNKEEIFDLIKKSKEQIDYGISLHIYFKLLTSIWFYLNDNVDETKYKCKIGNVYQNTEYIVCETENWNQFLEEIKTKWVDVDD